MNFGKYVLFDIDLFDNPKRNESRSLTVLGFLKRMKVVPVNSLVRHLMKDLYLIKLQK